MARIRRSDQPADPRRSKAKGGFRYYPLAALAITDPAKASAKIRERLAKHDGNVSAAARELDTTFKTFTRWIDKCAAAGYDPREQEEAAPATP